MEKYSRLGKNTVLIFVGSAGGKLLTFLLMPFYTRWLSTSGYGTVDILNVYMSLIMGIVSFRIMDSIFIFPKDQSANKQSKYFTTGWLFILISATLLLVGSKIYSLFGDTQNSLTQNIWYLYIITISTYIQLYSQQFCRAIDNILVYSIGGVVLSAFTVLLSFLLIPGYGIKGYIATICISNIITTIYSLVFSKAYKYIHLKSIDFGSLKEMLKYSIPLIPSSILWWLINGLNRPFMENWLGLSAIGIFAVANKFPTIILVLSDIFNSSWIISSIEEIKSNDYNVFFNKVLKLFTLSITSIVIMLIFLSKLLVQVFSSNEFYSAWKYIPILGLGAIFSGISSFVGSNFAATRESKYQMYSSFIGAFTAISLNYLLIPKFGLYGVSISVVFSFLTTMLSKFRFSKKMVQITDYMFYFYLLVIFGIVCISEYAISNLFLKFIVDLALTLALIIINKKYIINIYSRLKYFRNKNYGNNNKN